MPDYFKVFFFPVKGAQNLNLIPYDAENTGHKLYLDQNQKFAMFGVTCILALDGFSKKIVSHSSMPIKNNLRIHEEVYRYGYSCLHYTAQAITCTSYRFCSFNEIAGLQFTLYSRPAVTTYGMWDQI